MPQARIGPAPESAVAYPFEGMEQPQRDHLAGPEVRLRVLGHGAQLLIDVVEQGGDTLHSGHGLLRARQGFTLLTSVEDVHDQCKVPSEY